MEIIVVELEDGTQEYFDRKYEAFVYAKQAEDKKRHSVEYLACGGMFYEEDDGTVYSGQSLRMLLRSMDNVTAWLRSTYGEIDDEADL